MTLLRICVREELGTGLADWLVRDMEETVARMLALDAGKEWRGKKGDIKGEGGGDAMKNLVTQAQEHEAQKARPAAQSEGEEGGGEAEKKGAAKGGGMKTFTIC